MPASYTAVGFVFYEENGSGSGDRDLFGELESSPPDVVDEVGPPFDDNFDIGDTFSVDFHLADFNPALSGTETINWEYQGYTDALISGFDLPVFFTPGPFTAPELNFAFPDGVWVVAVGTAAGASLPANPTFPATINCDTVTRDLIDNPLLMCFLHGTHVVTPLGSRAVENLSTGDLVLTADGDSVPVKWLGRQSVATRFAGRRGRPVRISAGALGVNLPARDLCVTQDHALLIDGLLVNAGAMVNGTTVTLMDPADLGDTFTVYHIETEGHRVIVAEGAATETFIDYVERSRFDNYEEFVAMYGEPQMVPELDQPRISTARHLPPALRAKLGLDKAA